MTAESSTTKQALFRPGINNILMCSQEMQV